MAKGKERKPRPIITYALIAAMALIHLYLTLIPPEETLLFYQTYSLFPARLFDGIYIDTLLTHVFLHGNWVHLIVNCASLLGAGVIVETDLGHLKFLGAFITSGTIAGLSHSLLNPPSTVPIIGASGAIFGVIAVLFLLMPFKITYALIIPLPSVAVGLILSIIELYSLYTPTDLTIAHDAHIAGFAFGCIYAFTVDKKRALKGLVVALIVLAVMYYIGVAYGVI
ncbi:MAG: rhomboid family intramembrane serine protease [Candidatus Bathyarchaeota archaeon]|nr:rhomboid family intramembrane serine protease [Candidatus Bathyarchaeota archaeon]